MGNIISWTSEDGSNSRDNTFMPEFGISWTFGDGSNRDGLNSRDSTFMPEFGKDVSYSGPGGTSFGRNTAAFSNSVVSQALNGAQKNEAAKQATTATTEFERVSNPDTYESAEAPESFHIGEIIDADAIDEKYDPEKWKSPKKQFDLINEINAYQRRHIDNKEALSKEEYYELGKMYEAAATNLNNGSITSKVMSELIGNNRAEEFATISKRLLDTAYAEDEADMKGESKETLGDSAPASSRFTADMKGKSKVDTTPSKTFEDVKNEAKKAELDKDPLPNVGPRDYTEKPELKNDIASVNIADIKKAAEQTGTDTETVKAIAESPKFIKTIESKLGDILLKMGRNAARYNLLTLAVALYESVKNGEGLEKSIDKAIEALGLERDSMTQDEYDALYKEIEGIRSSIDRGDFKISVAGGDTAAATSDGTPTDFFDGLLNTDKTDYSGYNAGLTASDKNTKEIIVRVYKKDPVLRLLKC